MAYGLTAALEGWAHRRLSVEMILDLRNQNTIPVLPIIRITAHVASL